MALCDDGGGAGGGTNAEGPNMLNGSCKSVKPSMPCAIMRSTFEVAPIQDSMVMLLPAQFTGAIMRSWFCIVESHNVYSLVSDKSVGR